MSPDQSVEPSALAPMATQRLLFDGFTVNILSFTGVLSKLLPEESRNDFYSVYLNLLLVICDVNVKLINLTLAQAIPAHG
jgi:hypothetical protein